MNAAISVMAVFKVRLSFSGMIFETGLSLHFTGLQLSGTGGLFLLVPFVEFMRYRFSCLKAKAILTLFVLKVKRFL